MRRALDLFAGAGGVSVGLARAGFHVTAVDSNPKCVKHWRLGMERHAPPKLVGGFIVADSLEVLTERDWLLQFDFIWASPPCQRYSVATRITGRRDDHPDLIAPVRERLKASGRPYAIENVPGSPMGRPLINEYDPGGRGAHPLVLLCGTMFGLETPDGRAEIRRHRWFELSFPVLFRPQCQHGGAAESLSGRWVARTLSVVGKKGLPGISHARKEAHESRRVLCVAGGKAMSGGMAEPQGSRKRRAALSVTGSTPQRKVSSDYGKNISRETFSTSDARAAMGINWMPMKHLSQAIPPAYAEWIGRQAMTFLEERG